MHIHRQADWPHAAGGGRNRSRVRGRVAEEVAVRPEPRAQEGRATKPFILKSSGTPGAIASVVRHVGRASGRAYETPVSAVATDDGFVIALPYGPNTDWLKNVLASGSATIVHEGNTYRVDRPEVVPASVATPLFSSADQRTHRLFGVDECLLVRRAEPHDEAAPDPV